jgi:flagellar biosynthesis protein FliR
VCPAIVIDASGCSFGEQIWWVSLRIGAMLMLAPVIGTHVAATRPLDRRIAFHRAFAPLLPKCGAGLSGFVVR